jgi:hypothetical protein
MEDRGMNTSSLPRLGAELNPLTIDRAKLADIKVLETIKEGKSVYTRPGRKVPGQE